MINAKIVGMLLAAFVAGSFVASPELRAYAVDTITSADIVDGTITTADIGDGQVRFADIAGGAVTTSKIANNAVTGAKIVDSTVKSADIGDGEVKIADLAAGAVGTVEIVDGTIGYADLSRGLFVVDHRNDCDCGGTGWDPNGMFLFEAIHDSRITDASVVSVSQAGGDGIGVCSAAVSFGQATVYCQNIIPNGTGISYAIFTPG